MIRKPPEGWGRESAAVSTVRAAAAGGASVVKTGGRVMRGLYLCGLGAMMAVGALGSLVTGSIPGLIGGGAVSTLLIWFGLRAFKPKGEGAAASAPAMAGGTGVDYARGKLLGYSAFGLLATAAAFWGAHNLSGATHLASIVMIPVFAAMVVGAARKAMGDLTALRWDGRGLTAAGLWTRRSGSWAEVVSIGAKQVNTYAGYGLIKVGSTRSIVIRFTSGKVSVSESMLDLEGRSLEGVVLALQAAQMGRGVAAPAGARQPQADPRPSPRPAAQGFDPDEAVARYQAEQARAVAAAQPPQAAMNFPAAAGPARATFGRRGG